MYANYLDKELFDKVEMKNMRGGEGILTLYKLKVVPTNVKMYAVIIIPPHASIGLHEHVEDCEIIYVINGKATVFDDNNVGSLNEGDIHVCYKNHKHALFNNTESELKVVATILKEN